MNSVLYNAGDKDKYAKQFNNTFTTFPFLLLIASQHWMTMMDDDDSSFSRLHFGNIPAKISTQTRPIVTLKQITSR